MVSRPVSPDKTFEYRRNSEAKTNRLFFCDSFISILFSELTKCYTSLRDVKLLVSSFHFVNSFFHLSCHKLFMKLTGVCYFCIQFKTFFYLICLGSLVDFSEKLASLGFHPATVCDIAPLIKFV